MLKPIIRNKGIAPYLVGEANATLQPGDTLDLTASYLDPELAMLAVTNPAGTIAAGIDSGFLEVTMAPHRGAKEE